MTSSFADLGVPTALTDALAARGITIPTPIQAATLPDSLAGRDVLGRGRTGSGKTYAFLLPVVTLLAADRAATARRGRAPRSLILAPTRELARQIDEALAPLAAVAGLRSLIIFGGVGQNPQVRALQAGVDILVATPGRLEDLIGQGYADLRSVEVTVLDEADHMSDLGFLPAIKRLLDRTPKRGQRMLFSATLDGAVDVVAKRYLSNPVTHHADSAQSPVSTMDHHVLHIDAADRLDVLADLGAAPGRTLMFTRTKHGAKKLAKQLNGVGVPAVELHGNLGQNARVRNLDAFQSGGAATLVATDIAARGIHVDDVALVVHADPPVEHKAYLHRSGRTARAGASGTVVTLMTDAQVRDVRSLTRAAGIKATVTRAGATHPVLHQLAPGERVLVPGGHAPAQVAGGQSGGRGSSGGGRSSGGRSSGGRSSGGRGQGSGRGQGGSGAGSGQGRPGGQGASGRRNESRQGSGGKSGSTGQSRGRGRSAGGAGGRGASRGGSGSVVTFSTSTGGRSGRR